MDPDATTILVSLARHWFLTIACWIPGAFGKQKKVTFRVSAVADATLIPTIVLDASTIKVSIPRLLLVI
jgi:hypothetical protein